MEEPTLIVYIMTDMEGISGVSCVEYTQPDQPLYAEGRKLLMGDVNAAVAGAFEGGATEVLVNDGHGGNAHFIIEQLDRRAVYERPDASDYIPSLDERCSGLFMIGAHAMAGTLGGFLDHTQSSTSWLNYYINDIRCGEIGQCVAYAGHFGVPLLMLSGDRAACAEARQLCPHVETAEVKWARTRSQATCLAPAVAQGLIREAAKRAMGLVGKAKPWKIGLPMTIKIEFTRSDYADYTAARPGVERLDARTVRKVMDGQKDVLIR
jgi:D-amino peptidase